MQFVWTLDSCISSIHVFIKRLIKTTNNYLPKPFPQIGDWLTSGGPTKIYLAAAHPGLPWLVAPTVPVTLGSQSPTGWAKIPAWQFEAFRPWNPMKLWESSSMESNGLQSKKRIAVRKQESLTWSWWWGRQLPRSLNTTIAGFFMHSCYIICRSSIVRQMRKQPVGSKLRQRWSVCLHVFTEAGVDHFTIVSLEFGWQSQMHQYPTANGSRLSPTIIPLFFLQLVAPRWEMQVLPLDSLASTSSCSSCQRWHCFGLALDICWGTADSSLQYNNNPGTDAPWKHM